MDHQDGEGLRPDVKAQMRGADTEQAMEGEHDIATSSRQQAIFWRDTYREILTMEESVMVRILELMAAQSPTARREVELSNVPVISAQVERFRSRLGYWETRLKRVEATEELERRG